MHNIVIGMHEHNNIIIIVKCLYAAHAYMHYLLMRASISFSDGMNEWKESKKVCVNSGSAKYRYKIFHQ